MQRHVALKILSAHATGGRRGVSPRITVTILRAITATDASHPGHGLVVHLLHEFTFDSFYGKPICFVTDVLRLSVTNMKKLLLPDPRLPLRIVLLIVKHALKALEYLPTRQLWSCPHWYVKLNAQRLLIVKYVCPLDLKPCNILLRPSDVDQIVMHGLAEFRSTSYEIPKTNLPRWNAVPRYRICTTYFHPRHWSK
jgi:serine/threonine-protein kinase SRPK3